MDVHEIVRAHYGGADLEDTILAALARAGVDIKKLTVEDLVPVDELHAGFLPATEHLLAALDIDADTRLLDVGCGIGGPARAAAAAYSCTVTGVDLSPDFVAVARSLTDRVGLSPRVTYHVGSGDGLSFDDGSFDRAITVHVGMNIPDKLAVYDEVRRVLRPGGLFGVFDQMRAGEGDLPYPLPWAEDERSSFVETPDEYVAKLTAAGFSVLSVQDRTEAVAGPPATSRPGLSGQAVFGPRFGERIANDVAATSAGLLGVVLVVARADH